MGRIIEVTPRATPDEWTVKIVVSGNVEEIQRLQAGHSDVVVQAAPPQPADAGAGAAGLDLDADTISFYLYQERVMRPDANISESICSYWRRWASPDQVAAALQEPRL
jgi:hypothetical protein